MTKHKAKYMTNAQILNIQLNNYLGEHDRQGKQLDYEASGLKHEIETEYWNRKQKEILFMIKSYNLRHLDTTNSTKNSVNRKTSEKRAEIDSTNSKQGNISENQSNAEKPQINASNNQLERDLAQLEMQISINKAFRPWKHIVNEIVQKSI